MIKFRKDLEKGQVGEKVIANFLQTKGFTIQGFNNTKDYDILTSKGDKMVTFEIKTDEYETYKGETGNMFLEIKCNGKDSGIRASTADYFVYYYPQLESAWFIKLSNLNSLTRIPGLFHTSYGCGDDNKVIGLIASRESMKEYFTQFKIKK